MTDRARVGSVLLTPSPSSSSSAPLSATSRCLWLAFTYSFNRLFSSASLLLLVWWERILTPVDCDDPADEPWVDEAVDGRRPEESFALLVRIFGTKMSRRVQLAVTNIMPVKTKKTEEHKPMRIITRKVERTKVSGVGTLKQYNQTATATEYSHRHWDSRTQ
mmetsp:Transcript_17532/g.35196  ORF Transcript_17532/g.35196 Transcript_17532/m.35196 type:complete len:162 (+) Transcript_17532:114-599(+)